MIEPTAAEVVARLRELSDAIWHPEFGAEHSSKSDADFVLATAADMLERVVPILNGETGDGLKVEIAGDALAIVLPLDVLPHAVLACPGLWRGDLEEGPAVTDPDAFGKAVLEALRREDHDGTTRVHRMFDGAFEEACEQGAEGIRMADEPTMHVYQMSECEWWAAPSFAAAVSHYHNYTGDPPDEPREAPLSVEEMQRVCFLCENECAASCTDCVRTPDGQCSKTSTFAEQFAEYVARGDGTGLFWATEP